jgi:hypothetical protein
VANRTVNLKSFGAEGPNGYLFRNVTSAVTNFSRVESKVTSIAGFDGGIDEFGTGTAPRGKGTVTVNMWLTTVDPERMTALRDEVLQLPHWGVRELFLAPYNESEPDSWCYARCVDVKVPEDADQGTEYQQPVTLTFEVSSPFWYSRAGLEWVGAPTLVIGSGWTVKGAQTEAVITDGLELTAINRGNAPTPLTVEIHNFGGGWDVGDPGIVIGDPLLFIGGYGPSFTNRPLTVSALNARGVVLEQWTWDGVLAQHESLRVDAGELRVDHVTELSTTSGWDDFTIVRGTGFIRLAPGTTTIRFEGDFHGGTARLHYMDAWS